MAQHHPLQVQGVFQFRQKVPRQIGTVLRCKDLLFRKLWLLLSILARIAGGREPDLLVRRNVDSLCFRAIWLLVEILVRIPKGREPGVDVWRVFTLSRTSTLRNIQEQQARLTFRFFLPSLQVLGKGTGPGGMAGILAYSNVIFKYVYNIQAQ